MGPAPRFSATSAVSPDTLFPRERCLGTPRRVGDSNRGDPVDGKLATSKPRMEQPGPREAREIHHRTLPDHGFAGRGKACD